MAIDLGSKSFDVQERTTQVTRVTPAEGNYRVIVEREEVMRDSEGAIIARKALGGKEFRVSDLLTSPSAATLAYLAACQSAASLADLLQAESAWYDALIVESRQPPAEPTPE